MTWSRDSCVISFSTARFPSSDIYAIQQLIFFSWALLLQDEKYMVETNDKINIDSNLSISFKWWNLLEKVTWVKEECDGWKVKKKAIEERMWMKKKKSTWSGIHILTRMHANNIWIGRVLLKLNKIGSHLHSGRKKKKISCHNIDNPGCRKAEMYSHWRVGVMVMKQYRKQVEVRVSKVH